VNPIVVYADGADGPCRRHRLLRPRLVSAARPRCCSVGRLPSRSGSATRQSPGERAWLATAWRTRWRGDRSEIDEDGYDLGAPEITGNVVATLTRPHSEPLRAAARLADGIDLRIAAPVASLVPDDATLQFGPGGIGEGIARALRKPVSIFSGLVTDAMADLANRGLLNGVATAAYAWGRAPIRHLAASGRLRWATVEVTNDITYLSAIPRFIGCNTALQDALDGSVNVERVGGRLITSIGGHADFCAGASRSLGGMSAIALRSTTSKGASNIVRMTEVVSTPKCDVSVVVTEHTASPICAASATSRAVVSPRLRRRSIVLVC
jgi:acyl-CoA hydrolase